MSEKCEKCDGRGYDIVDTKKCPECKGEGKSKSFDLMKLPEKEIANFLKNGSSCAKCGGTGEIQIKEECMACSGKGSFYKCKTCGVEIAGLYNGEEVCNSCAKKLIVYKLDD